MNQAEHILTQWLLASTHAEARRDYTGDDVRAIMTWQAERAAGYPFNPAAVLPAVWQL